MKRGYSRGAEEPPVVVFGALIPGWRLISGIRDGIKSAFGSLRLNLGSNPEYKVKV